MNTLSGRVVLIGDSNVGKTSIIRLVAQSNSSQQQNPTVGAVFQTFQTVYEGSKIILQIWDTAGHERYRSLGPIYYRKSNAAIAVFDLTNKETMLNLQGWVDAFREHSDDPYVIVVGNKCDLVDEIQVSKDEAMEWAQSLGADCFLTSAVTREGVDAVFDALTKYIFSTLTAENGSGTNEDTGISIDAVASQPHADSGCKC